MKKKQTKGVSRLVTFYLSKRNETFLYSVLKVKTLCVRFNSSCTFQSKLVSLTLHWLNSTIHHRSNNVHHSILAWLFIRSLRPSSILSITNAIETSIYWPFPTLCPLPYLIFPPYLLVPYTLHSFPSWHWPELKEI